MNAGRLFVKTIFILIVLVLLIGQAQAQDVPTCPVGYQCITQERFNKVMDRLDELVAAKDVIAKMLAERGASDAAINSAMKVIEGWKSLDAINNTIIAKQKDVITLYEQTIKLYAGLVENLEKRLMKPKSAFSKFLDVLKNAAILLAGITLGRGI